MTIGGLLLSKICMGLLALGFEISKQNWDGMKLTRDSASGFEPSKGTLRLNQISLLNQEFGHFIFPRLALVSTLLGKSTDICVLG